jgi:hypothetical protein
MAGKIPGWPSMGHLLILIKIISKLWNWKKRSTIFTLKKRYRVQLTEKGT